MKVESRNPEAAACHVCLAVDAVSDAVSIATYSLCCSAR